jgi:adenylylsulfate kinase-like enzyme
MTGISSPYEPPLTPALTVGKRQIEVNEEVISIQNVIDAW